MEEYRKKYLETGDEEREDQEGPGSVEAGATNKSKKVKGIKRLSLNRLVRGLA